MAVMRIVDLYHHRQKWVNGQVRMISGQAAPALNIMVALVAAVN